MRIALITDTHWGARGDSLAFIDYFNKFYYNFFFPYLIENNITSIVHLGDIVDRRKYINYISLKHFRKFINTCTENNISLDVIIGNHDTVFKNTNEVNCMKELFSNTKYNVNYYESPTEVTFDGLPIAFLPWVCTQNYEESLKFLNDTKCQVMFGHLEIQGFEMHKGEVCQNGFDRSLFNKFDIVCSGHFHHKSSSNNIYYLGCPYQMNWTDYNDAKGFHIFDTDTRELQFIENPFEMFYKIHYDDTTWKDIEIMDSYNLQQLQGTYCKIIVHQKNNPYWFDMFIDKIEKVGVLDLKVVDDHLNLNLEDDNEFVNEAEDTVTIMNKVVQQMDISVDKGKLQSFLKNLYGEAMTIEGS